MLKPGHGRIRAARGYQGGRSIAVSVVGTAQAKKKNGRGENGQLKKKRTGEVRDGSILRSTARLIRPRFLGGKKK